MGETVGDIELDSCMLLIMYVLQRAWRYEFMQIDENLVLFLH